MSNGLNSLFQYIPLKSYVFKYFTFFCVLSSKCVGMMIKYHLAKGRIMRIERLQYSSSVLKYPLYLLSHPFHTLLLFSYLAGRGSRSGLLMHLSKTTQHTKMQKSDMSSQGLKGRLCVWRAWAYNYYSI